MAIGTCAAGSRIPWRPDRVRQCRPPTPRRGIPAIPTPRVPKDRATLQIGGGAGCAHDRSAPEGGPRTCDRGAPYHPGGRPGKPHPGGSKGSSGIANGREPGCASRGHGDWDLRSGVPNPLAARPRAAVSPPNTPTGHPGNPNPEGSKGPRDVANWGGGGLRARPQRARGRASDVRQRRPLPPRGASRQAPPRGFQRIERHCKRAGAGMRVPWAWRLGPAQRGPESPGGPTACGSVAPQHPDGASRQSQPRGFQRTARRCKLGGGRAARTTAARPRAGLGRATEAPPTTPGGVPASPTPGVPKDRAALQTGGSRDARPVGMAIGTCAAGSRIPWRPDRVRQCRPPTPRRGIPAIPTPRVPKDRATLQIGGGAGCAHDRSAPEGGPRTCDRGAPYHPGGRPGKPHPGVSKGPSGIANGRVAGCASRVQWALDLR
ncbi:hypothetical protein COCNU_scaffold071467G000010 [Cocos nucifera]|nr:hypothetical protein [Cocos nucifera]